VLIRGRLETGFQIVTSTAPVQLSTRMYLEGSRAVQPFELYVQTDSRIFLRLNGDHWDFIDDAPKYDSPFRPDVLWMGPNRASTMSMGRGRNTIITYDGGQVVEEVVGQNSGLSSIAFVPGVGRVIGRDDGTIWIDRDDGNGFVHVPVGRELHFARIITPIGDGFFYGAGFEINFLEFHFIQYFPSTGMCPPEKLTQYVTTHIAELANGVYVGAGLGNFDAPIELTLLDVIEPPGNCSGPAY
jgi:hypothetical protein